MQKYITTSITSVLLIIQLGILYFWIVDWQKIVTQTGLIIWGSSILVGIWLYLIHRKSNEKILSINRKVIFVSTSMTVLLAILSLLIESIVRSMP
ncbi:MULTISPECIES: hypothetical protein [Bacillus]|uniref:hypothetical protein n=1 Tax=Bacillus TaxID=1386 RepID=UPI000362311D|nr:MULTISPECIES: hypothetical protein [Bacillus]MCI0768226.1 hypothetical protein [Bacillus sp. TL12]